MKKTFTESNETGDMRDNAMTTPRESSFQQHVNTTSPNLVSRTTKRTPMVTLQASSGVDERYYSNENNNGETSTKNNDTRVNEKQDSNAHVMLNEDDLHHMSPLDNDPLLGTKESEEFVWPANDVTASGGVAGGGNNGSSFNRDDPTEAYKSEGVTSPFTRNEESMVEGSGTSLPSAFGALKWQDRPLQLMHEVLMRGNVDHKANPSLQHDVNGRQYDHNKDINNNVPFMENEFWFNMNNAEMQAKELNAPVKLHDVTLVNDKAAVRTHCYGYDNMHVENGDEQAIIHSQLAQEANNEVNPKECDELPLRGGLYSVSWNNPFALHCLILFVPLIFGIVMFGVFYTSFNNVHTEPVSKEISSVLNKLTNVLIVEQTYSSLLTAEAEWYLTYPNANVHYFMSMWATLQSEVKSYRDMVDALYGEVDAFITFHDEDMRSTFGTLRPLWTSGAKCVAEARRVGTYSTDNNIAIAAYDKCIKEVTLFRAAFALERRSDVHQNFKDMRSLFATNSHAITTAIQAYVSHKQLNKQNAMLFSSPEKESLLSDDPNSMKQVHPLYNAIGASTQNMSLPNSEDEVTFMTVSAAMFAASENTFRYATRPAQEKPSGLALNYTTGDNANLYPVQLPNDLIATWKTMFTKTYLAKEYDGFLPTIAFTFVEDSYQVLENAATNVKIITNNMNKRVLKEGLICKVCIIVIFILCTLDLLYYIYVTTEYFSRFDTFRIINTSARSFRFAVVRMHQTVIKMLHLRTEELHTEVEMTHRSKLRMILPQERELYLSVRLMRSLEAYLPLPIRFPPIETPALSLTHHTILTRPTLFHKRNLVAIRFNFAAMGSSGDAMRRRSMSSANVTNNLFGESLSSTTNLHTALSVLEGFSLDRSGLVMARREKTYHAFVVEVLSLVCNYANAHMPHSTRGAYMEYNGLCATLWLNLSEEVPYAKLVAYSICTALRLYCQEHKKDVPGMIMCCEDGTVGVIGSYAASHPKQRNGKHHTFNGSDASDTNKRTVYSANGYTKNYNNEGINLNSEFDSEDDLPLEMQTRFASLDNGDDLEGEVGSSYMYGSSGNNVDGMNRGDGAFGAMGLSSSSSNYGFAKNLSYANFSHMNTSQQTQQQQQQTQQQTQQQQQQVQKGAGNAANVFGSNTSNMNDVDKHGNHIFTGNANVHTSNRVDVHLHGKPNNTMTLPSNLTHRERIMQWLSMMLNMKWLMPHPKRQVKEGSPEYNYSYATSSSLPGTGNAGINDKRTASHSTSANATSAANYSGHSDDNGSNKNYAPQPTHHIFAHNSREKVKNDWMTNLDEQGNVVLQRRLNENSVPDQSAACLTSLIVYGNITHELDTMQLIARTHGQCIVANSNFARGLYEEKKQFDRDFAILGEQTFFTRSLEQQRERELAEKKRLNDFLTKHKKHQHHHHDDDHASNSISIDRENDELNKMNWSMENTQSPNSQSLECNVFTNKIGSNNNENNATSNLHQRRTRRHKSKHSHSHHKHSSQSPHHRSHRHHNHKNHHSIHNNSMEKNNMQNGELSDENEKERLRRSGNEHASKVSDSAHNSKGRKRRGKKSNHKGNNSKEPSNEVLVQSSSSSSSSSSLDSCDNSTTTSTTEDYSSESDGQGVFSPNYNNKNNNEDVLMEHEMDDDDEDNDPMSVFNHSVARFVHLLQPHPVPLILYEYHRSLTPIQDDINANGASNKNGNVQRGGNYMRLRKQQQQQQQQQSKEQKEGERELSYENSEVEEEDSKTAAANNNHVNEFAVTAQQTTNERHLQYENKSKPMPITTEDIMMAMAPAFGATNNVRTTDASPSSKSSHLDELSTQLARQLEMHGKPTNPFLPPSQSKEYYAALGAMSDPTVMINELMIHDYTKHIPVKGFVNVDYHGQLIHTRSECEIRAAYILVLPSDTNDFNNSNSLTAPAAAATLSSANNYNSHMDGLSRHTFNETKSGIMTSALTNNMHRPSILDRSRRRFSTSVTTLCPSFAGCEVSIGDVAKWERMFDALSQLCYMCIELEPSAHVLSAEEADKMSNLLRRVRDAIVVCRTEALPNSFLNLALAHVIDVVGTIHNDIRDGPNAKQLHVMTPFALSTIDVMCLHNDALLIY